MTPILELRNIQKSYRRRGERQQVLHGINLTIAPGECVGLVGRSGCGKSTLIKIIARLIDADDGTLLFDGEDVTQAKGAALRHLYDRLQIIFQLPQASFDPRHTIGWSIAEPLRAHGLSPADCHARVLSLLAQVGLPKAHAGRYPHEVSGGECQRASIARALALSPALLICDEATSALDVTVQQDIIALLRRLIADQQMACLFVTHDLALLPQIADRIVVLANGIVAESGDVSDIICHPQSMAAKELLSAACQLQENAL